MNMVTPEELMDDEEYDGEGFSFFLAYLGWASYETVQQIFVETDNNIE